ncbi:MAG TPA: flagellar basal body protein, partial [Calditrichia bacterium]|nr:flagellar basal body protein [Calditrichia bacterium]
MSLNQLMEIGRRSLFANQRAINITSKNIANAGTEGYTRQRVNMTNLAIGVPGIGQIGVGVEADTVSRIQQRLVE